MVKKKSPKHTLTMPADVPQAAHKQFKHNYTAITRSTNRLFLFACDQKMEHLDLDFQGSGIHADARTLEHVFNIASRAPIGALATHFGLISRYGNAYPNINYIVKLNGKSNLIPTKQHEPFSNQLWSVADVVALKKTSKLSICGVGYTIYLGSEYEHVMLAQAAQIIHQAHQHGLIAIIWIYPRGKAITNDADPVLLAGAAGIAHSLGADFVKIKQPENAKGKSDAALLTRAIAAAGNTGVICSGGEKIDPQDFLKELHEQLQVGAQGCATGRNIFQRSEKDAIAFANAMAALVYKNESVHNALKIYAQMKSE